MRSKYIIFFIFVIFCLETTAQSIFVKEQIYSPYVLQDERAVKRRQKLIEQANSLNTLNIDSNAADIEIALWAVSQFVIRTPQSDSGVAKLVKQYNRLDESSQRALLELVYGLYPTEFAAEMKSIFLQATHAKNFGITAAYLLRIKPTPETKQFILSRTGQVNIASEKHGYIMDALRQQLSVEDTPLPDMDSLFAWQQVHKYKVVYSFQRANREFAGRAIVQNADGSFVRDSITGKLKTFVQLARSASNLPYYITNGSTPQGVFTITGTGISRNAFIGPTPNLQLAMMYETTPAVFTHYFPVVFNATPERIYRSYVPGNWQNWSGLMEAYNAGRVGRTEIIAHGTTISPDWFTNKTYYPISPTLGCLCGREIWDPQTGRIINSDQLDMVNAFVSTKGTQGYLIVINLDAAAAPVSAEEIEKLVDKFERR